MIPQLESAGGGSVPRATRDIYVFLHGKAFVSGNGVTGKNLLLSGLGLDTHVIKLLLLCRYHVALALQVVP